MRTGFIEGHGKFYPQPRIEIRPRPERSFEGRTYAVASSEDSIEAAARLKARMLMFADRPWPARLPGIERYRALYQQYNGVAAAPVVTADQCICAATSDEANELAERHMASFVDSNLEHYELMSTHFATAKGYDAYAKKSELARSAGRDGLVNALLQVAVRGTPEQVLRAYEARRELLGDFELNSSFRFGGIPLAKAEASMRLFAKEVMPVLKGWKPATQPAQRRVERDQRSNRHRARLIGDFSVPTLREDTASSRNHRECVVSDAFMWILGTPRVVHRDRCSGTLIQGGAWKSHMTADISPAFHPQSSTNFGTRQESCVMRGCLRCCSVEFRKGQASAAG